MARHGFRHVLCAALTVLCLLLMACSPQATPTPVPTAAPPTTAAPAAKAVLTVAGKAFSLQDLQALQQVSTEIDGKQYSGVRFLDVLQAANLQAPSIVLVSSDGYSSNASVTDMTEQCLLAYNTTGGVNAVLPGLVKSTWVKDVVTITASTEPSAPTTQPAAKPTAASSPAGGPIQLTDGAGRSVELPKLPERLVVVGRGPHMALHLLYMFPEGRQRLVGMEKRGATASDFLPFVDPAFNNKVVMNANPNTEQIASLNPDLVIMKGVTEDTVAQSLAKVGIPSVYLALETPAQFVQDVTNLGIVLGNSKRAQEILDFYQSRIDRLTKGLADVQEADKPRVLLMEYTDSEGSLAVKVPAKVWMQTIEVQTAGGNPVWLEGAQQTDGWTVTNLEQIAVWDPDKMFLVVWYKLDPQEVINALKVDSKWSMLKAVKNNETYAFPTDIFGWDQPEPRWILGMQWLATHMYPERFKDIDVHAEIMAFFGQLYGMDKASIEASILPKVKMDVR